MARDIPAAPLSDLELDVLAFIEEHWHAYELWPSVPQVLKVFPSFDAAGSFAKVRFQNALRNRGIPRPPVETKFERQLNAHGFSVENLTPHQVAAVVTLTDFMDMRSNAVKLRELGITTIQWNAWMRDAKFKTLFNKLSRKNFSNAQHVGRMGLVRSMDKGDVAAIKYFDEITGESPEHKNLQVLLSRLVEAIQLHVKDPTILHAIEQSFGDIMAGRKIQKQIEEAEIIAID